VKDERAPHKCQICGTGYKRLGSSLDAHVCTPIADTNSNDKDHGNKTEPFKKSNTIPISTECNIPVPLMGHGLVVTHRNQNYLTNAVKILLEGEYLKGVTNSGNRKGVLEMVETCCNKLPFS
jgi:hypothetical protein